MRLQFYLSLTILFAILSSDIGASSENTRESYVPHIRKKRVIDRSPGGNKPVSITKVPYIVDLRINGKRNCGGTILSSVIIITAAHCVLEHAIYTVVSGSGRMNEGIHHSVSRIIINEQYRVSRIVNDLALLKIFPPIDLIHSPNRHIELHDGNVRPNSHGVISGWGCTHISSTSVTFPDELRSATVSVFSGEVCHTLHVGFAPITSKLICTFDGYRSCCKGDSGGPLVVDGRLLGINVWTKAPLLYPDVFTKVSEYHHAVWISVAMRELNGEF